MRSDKSVADRSKQRGDVDGVHVGGLLLRVQPRQPQQIAHQALHSSGVAIDHLEELPPLLGFDRIVHQRFDVAAHRRQRRAQLVRHVRHEIAPHAIDPAQIADVVQHEHGAATFGARGCGLRAKNARAAGELTASSGTSIGGRCSPFSAAPSWPTTPGWRTAST